MYDPNIGLQLVLNSFFELTDFVIFQVKVYSSNIDAITRRDIMATIDRFQKENEQNRKLAKENALMCKLIIELCTGGQMSNDDISYQ